MTSTRSSALALATLLAVAPAHAEGWSQEVAPYLWGAAMEGSTGVGDVQADIDMSFGDILDNLEMGFMGTYRATHDRYSVGVDVVYMGLGAHGTGPAGFAKADVDVDQLALEVQGGYAMTEQFELFGGLRYVDLSGDLDVHGSLGSGRSGSLDQNWVDPFVGARYTLPLGDRWSATLRGDVGGFGVGSDFAWQAVALLRWHASDNIDLIGGYRYVDMDYEDGSGSHRFVYDVVISGPALGMAYRF